MLKQTRVDAGANRGKKLLTNPQFDLSELEDNQINQSDFGINTCTCGMDAYRGKLV